jgi:hypothetical protein
MNVNRDSVSTLAAAAANEPTRFNATERSAFIRSNVQQVRRMVSEGRYSIDDIKAIFPEFSEQYPNLLEMLTRPGGYDERSLNLMINMLDKMGAGRASQHEASIQVGQHLLNTYVKPELDGQR